MKRWLLARLLWVSVAGRAAEMPPNMENLQFVPGLRRSRKERIRADT